MLFYGTDHNGIAGRHKIQGPYFLLDAINRIKCFEAEGM